MKLNRFFILAIALFAFIFSNAQNSVWYFGSSNTKTTSFGLDFSGGGTPAVRNFEPAIGFYESVSVVSDVNGNVLYYTDGIEVYDASNNLMSGAPAALQGTGNGPTASSVQGAFSLLRPGSFDEYYLFTSQAIDGPANGLRVHRIDMSLPGNGTLANPLGEMVTVDSLLMSSGTEMMTAYGNCGSDSVWILTHLPNSWDFVRVLITSDGVQSVQTQTLVTNPATGAGFISALGRGSMDISPDGTKLLMTGQFPIGSWIIDFDKSTGVLSNPQEITIPSAVFGLPFRDPFHGYGSEFSPDGSKAYLAANVWSGWGYQGIWQYEVSTGEIREIPSTAGRNYGEIITGNDDRLYIGKVSEEASLTLAVMDNPNAVADGSNSVAFDNAAYSFPNSDQAAVSYAMPQGFFCLTQDTCKIDSVVAVCDTVSPFLFTADPSGGSWGGGAYISSGGLFDPSLAGGGTHWITYQGGCIGPDSVQIQVDVCCPPINVNDASGDICVGENIDLAALVVEPNDGVWTIAQGTGGSITGNSIFNSTGAAAGAFKLYYSLSPAAASGCQAYDSIEFNVNALPIINLNSAPICQGETTTLDAGNAGATYLWSPSGNTGQTELVSTVGPHKVIVTLPGTGCVDSAEYTVTVNPLPTISITAPTASCDNESAEALVGSPAGGDWFLNDVPSISGQFDPAALGAGTHEIKYSFTDGNGCSNADSIDVVVNSAPTVVIDPIAITCSNDDVVTMSATPVSGSWFVNGNASSDQFDPSANVGNNTVRYSYTDGNGCADSAEISVNINTAPVASIDPVTISCNNDDVFTLTGGPNATGDWILNGVVQANNQFDPSTNLGNNSIRYAVTENGCFDTADVNVNINAAPVASIDPVTISCNNDDVFTLTGGPNATGDWILNGIVQANNQFDPSTNLGNNAIRYAVTENGCFDTADLAVTINAAPVASIDPITITCSNDGVISLTGGPNGTGDWILNGVVQANNQFDPSTNLGNNSIRYAVTENGCFDTADLAVTINAAPVASIDPITITCSNDGVISLTGGPNATGDWILNGTVQADNQFDPSTNLGNNAIRYAVTENGCFDTADVNVNINAAPVASIDPVTISCNNDDVFTLTGGPNVTGDWILNGIVQANNQFDPSTNLGNNAISYAVTENGCFDTADLAVTINAAPVASIDPVTITCSNDGVISLTGGPNATGDWILNGTVQANNQFDPSANVGNNVIRYAVTENGCFDTADVNVNINAAPTAGIDASNTVWCSNESVTLTAQPGAGFNYTWSQNGLNSTDQVVSVAGEGPFRLVIQDQTTLCYDTTSIEFIAQLPNPFLGADDSACTNKVFMLTPGDYPSYVWSTGENDTTITFGLVADTTIWVDVTDAQGCTNRDSIVLTLRHPFVLEITGDSTTCSDGFATLTAVGTPQVLNATYWWTGDASTSTSASYNTAGLVKVIVSDEDNCTDSATTTITVNPTPVVSFVNEVDSFCSLGQEVYDAKLWVNGDSTTQAGQYIFNLETYSNNVARFTYAPTQVVGYYTDLNGCADADTLNLEEYCEPTIINLPNVFVPGGLDNTSFRPLGMNDANFIELFNNIVSSEFTVYNRWGLKVFQSGNVIPNWDGMFENRPVASGTYFWVFKYKDSSLKDYHLNGFVQVIQQRD